LYFVKFTSQAYRKALRLRTVGINEVYILCRVLLLIRAPVLRKPTVSAELRMKWGLNWVYRDRQKTDPINFSVDSQRQI